MNGVAIVAARRTPIGVANRGFAEVPVHDLAAAALAETARMVAPLELAIDDVVLGNCMGPGGSVARVAALAAGLGEHVPGVTVDRQCGSGLDAVLQAASRVRAGDAQLVLAGGAESASTAPHRRWPSTGERYLRAPFAPPRFADPDMGAAADAVADRYGIGRVRQDEWAARSHRLAVAASASGCFDAELVPVAGVSRDERPRAGVDLPMLARFSSAFTPGGTVTAGNSCADADGAATMAVLPAALAIASGLPALRVRAAAITAGSTALPGIGAAAAIELALQRAGASVADLGHVEITEAFAAQVLAVSDLVGLDESTISADGGAIAFGHAWGASGAVVLVRLAARMVTADDARLGLAACSIGGGQGIAMIVERVS